jgi:hypothetical protein
MCSTECRQWQGHPPKQIHYTAESEVAVYFYVQKQHIYIYIYIYMQKAGRDSALLIATL